MFGSLFCAIGKALGGCKYESTSITSPYKSGGSSGNIPSPRIEVDLTNVSIPSAFATTVQNTNSMEPLIDVGHTIFVTDNISNLNLGDIIIFSANGQSIIHSIVEIGDDGAWYCKTQGLNIKNPDPYTIRKADISYLVLGIFWTKQKAGYIAENGD